MKSKLFTSWFETPMGTLQMIADEQDILFLGFEHQKRLKNTIEKIKLKQALNPLNQNSNSSSSMNHLLQEQETPLMKNFKKELGLYFKKKLKKFETPLNLKFIGTPFQQKVWKTLEKIPFSETRTYLDIAKAIAKPKAVRAVANAIGANPMTIVIPCHRVIASNGGMGGYAGGIHRKEQLLHLEQRSSNI